MDDRSEAEAITVEFVFDPACPWCFIGKRRLEQALEARPGVVARIMWRPFLLHPDMPSEGLPAKDYMMRRYGGEARVRRVLRAITEAGQSSRIPFAFDHIRRAPSSVDAHRLIRYSEAEGLEHAAVEALFHSLFVLGRDIGNRRVLADIGASIGLDRESLRFYLDSGADAEFVRQSHLRSTRAGISGVPSFVFDGNLVIAGAQDPRILGKMLDVARENVRSTQDVRDLVPAH